MFLLVRCYICIILKKVLYPTETCRFVLKLFRRIKTTVHSSQRVGFGVINYILHMYKSYIQPLFDYNDIFLENTHVRLKTKLINLQRRCLRRCLPENRKYGKDEIHTVSGINTLHDRANTHLLKNMYKRAQDERDAWIDVQIITLTVLNASMYINDIWP